MFRGELNGSDSSNCSVSFRSPSEKSCTVYLKSPKVMSPFLQQLRTFENREHKSCRNASRKLHKQNQQYKEYNASILKETKDIMNERATMKFCEPELLRIMEAGDTQRERETDLMGRVRNFRVRSYDTARSKIHSNGSLLSLMCRIEGPNKKLGK